MSEREELSELSDLILSEFRPPKDGYGSWQLTPVASAMKIRAAGYRKARIVTTPEELDTLGFKATVLDADQHVWVNDGDTLDQWASVTHPESYGGPKWLGSADIALPATVLYEPQP